MSKFLCSILLGVLALGACQKEDTDETPVITTPTVANLAGSYKIAKAAIINFGAETDVTGFYPSCLRDDIYKLNANMSYEVVDAGEKCNPPGNLTGTWSLTNNTTITLDGTSGTIRKYDGKNLEITGTVNGASGVIYYVRQ
jgi:hypothetical protein